MTVLQVWVLITIPALLLGLTLFLGRSPARTAAGYAILTAGFLSVVAFDRIAGAIFATALFLLFAAGRGGTIEKLRQVRESDADVPGLVGTDRTLDPPRRT